MVLYWVNCHLPNGWLWSFFECLWYGFNEWVLRKGYGAVDNGGSIYIHVFGAYFGLAISFVNSVGFKKHVARVKPVYASDTFAMIGTLFLWLFWPSFNAALADQSAQHRVIVNTVIGLCVSCVTAFCWSAGLNDGKFRMIDVQHATLAGGVALGSSVSLVVAPYAPMLIGWAAGTVAIVGGKFLTPILDRWGFHDTMGVHNVHGLAGIIGALAGIFSAVNQHQATVYGEPVGTLFPRRSNDTAVGGQSWSEHDQAGYQAAALITSIGLAILGGLITGVVMSVIDPLIHGSFFKDEANWHVPSDYHKVKLAEDSGVSLPSQVAEDEEQDE
eukprot:TRINITY_DN2604_c0_g1_i1.p1 TRINITY_DN2604_c0_g1~~TRINITY_DN2604_c0_g1_i1.p1  ORF type:complete len:329 (-),score=76.60 TRINITY_DN2604_c0_g1_i1:59-1045(-)